MKSDSRPAARAWRRHVANLPAWPSRWADLAERFVADLRPTKPEPVLALVLLCLDLATSWASLLDGGWIQTASVHRYVYFDCPGYGDGRTYGVLSKLVKWLRSEGRIDDGQMLRLLTEIDDAREGSGLARANGSMRRDRVFRVDEMKDLAVRFARGLDDSFLQTLAAPALSVLVTHVRIGADHLRFGDLDVAQLSVASLELDGERHRSEVIDASRTLLSILARFYGWLAHQGYLDGERAEDIAGQLSMAAFRTAA